MPRISRRSLAQLPSVDEVWFITTVQLRMWISPEDAPPSRPYAIFIVDLDHGLIMALDLTETEPTPEQVRDSLFKAMSKPAKVTGPARRPKAIGVADPYLGEALTGLIGEARLEMTIYEMQTPEEFNEIVREMELQLHHGKPELAAGFFAAAYFYRAAPRVHLTNNQMLAVRHPAEPDYRYVVVMGNGGVEYGLATYLTWADVEQMFEAVDDPLETMPQSGLHSMFFDRIDRLPFDDLEAVQQHGW